MSDILSRIIGGRRITPEFSKSKTLKATKPKPPYRREVFLEKDQVFLYKSSELKIEP